MLKKILLWGLAPLALAVIIFGGGFYYKWFYADQDIPIFSDYNGESQVADNFLEAEDDFRAALLNTHNQAKMPALSAAVYVDGEFAWAGTVGLANIETGGATSQSNKFRLGSTSKIFTSTLALRMVEKGAVDLDEPISSYIDNLPENYRQLTLRRLLSHTSGVRNYKMNFGFFPPHEGAITGQYNSATEALEIFLGDPLEFPQGEGFQYSSWGFVLASAVLEAAGGKSFPDLLQDELLEPLQFTNIVTEFSGRDEDGKVGLYLTDDGQYTLAFPVNTSVKWAAGGLLATPTDVANFGAKLLAGDIINKQSLTEIWTPVALSDGSMNEQNYGLGFRIDTSVRLLGEDRPTLMIHHGGRVDGGSSFIMIIPEYGVVASVQANTDELKSREAVQTLAYELIRIAIRHKENKHASQAPDFLDPEYINKTFQGNLSDMEDILSAREETPKNTELLNAFRARFIERTDGLDLESEDPLIQAVGRLVQEYWRNALLTPEQREAYERTLAEGVITLLQNSKYASPDINPRTLMPHLSRIFEEKGYYSSLGRTAPLLEFMIWKENDQNTVSVELTDGAYGVQVNYLSNFVTLGWSSFATFGGPSTGGWAKDDGLFVVSPKWDLDSENFNVSFLKHETRHFADYEKYPELEGPDLEYRAKLTELFFAEKTVFDLLKKFTDHAAKGENLPHPLANWHIITDLSRELLDKDWPNDAKVWESISKEEIRAATKNLLERHNQALNEAGSKTTKGILKP